MTDAAELEKSARSGDPTVLMEASSRPVRLAVLGCVSLIHSQSNELGLTCSHRVMAHSMQSMRLCQKHVRFRTGMVLTLSSSTVTFRYDKTLTSKTNRLLYPNRQ